MIIYYAMTKFHLIFSITHKRITYGDKDAVLFLYSGLQGLEEEYDKIVNAGFFKEVYIVPEIQLKRSWVPLNDKSPEKDIEKNVVNMVHDIEEWLPIKISREDTIYLANDHWALGTYCIYKKIPYHYYEDGVGMLSKPEYSYELVRKMNVTHSIVAKYMGAFGLNENVVEKIADLENQTEGFKDEKAVHFSLKDQLKNLSKEDMGHLLNIFGAPELKGQEDMTILLTEHFVNMKRLSIEGQKELYALLVDFFCESQHLCIKPHPNDFQINYGQIFPEADMISRFFPSELLPYCFNVKLKMALAACSTSVFGLKDAADRILRFDIDIENHYNYLLRYYAAAIILKQLKNFSIKTVNAYEDLLNGFLSADKNISSGKEKNCVYIVDDKKEKGQVLEDLNPQDVVVYINSSDYFYMFSERDFVVDEKNWCAVRIRKRLLPNTLMQNEDTEYVWIYSQDVKKLEQIKTIKEERELKHVGVFLDVDCITDNPELKIRILEGNLRASLVRIEKYKSQEKEYQETIRELHKKLEDSDHEVISMLTKALEERHK